MKAVYSNERLFYSLLLCSYGTQANSLVGELMAQKNSAVWLCGKASVASIPQPWNYKTVGTTTMESVNHQKPLRSNDKHRYMSFAISW